jgi:hypothetical protein
VEGSRQHFKRKFWVSFDFKLRNLSLKPSKKTITIKNGGILNLTFLLKISDVLLAALSDTLAENPELMSKARQALGIKI